MIKLFKKCGNASYANTVGGKLILTLPNAITPAVWQMDLAETQSAALEIHIQENGQASLELKATKGKNTVIASFDKREDAIDALMAASKAMENAQAQMQSCETPSAGGVSPQFITAPKAKGGFFQKMFTIVGVLAIIFLLYSFVMVFTGGGRSSVTQVSGASAQGRAAQSGVPVSADDFLSGR